MTALELIPPAEIESLDTAKPLAEIFQPFQNTLEKWQAKADTLTVTSIDQKTEMAQARLARLELRDARCTMKETKLNLTRTLKERTNKIELVERTIREQMEILEQQLFEYEQFAIRHAAKIKAELKETREKEFAQHGATSPHFDLSDLSPEVYAVELGNVKILRQAQLDTAARAEAARIAKDQAEAKERERLAVENKRLREESAKREQAIKEEREAVEAQRRKDKETSEKIAAKERAEADRLAAVERAARIKAESEAKALRDAETARQAAESKAAKKAAAAPDKVKLRAFAESMRNLPRPLGLRTPAAEEMLEQFSEQLNDLANQITENAETL